MGGQEPGSTTLLARFQQWAWELSGRGSQCWQEQPSQCRDECQGMRRGSGTPFCRDLVPSSSPAVSSSFCCSKPQGLEARPHRAQFHFPARWWHHENREFLDDSQGAQCEVSLFPSAPRTSRWPSTCGTTGRMRGYPSPAPTTSAWRLTAGWWRRSGSLTCFLCTPSAPSSTTLPRITSCWGSSPMGKCCTAWGKTLLSSSSRPFLPAVFFDT